MLIRNSMIVSVHIPKTGGTSFRAGLQQKFGERLLLDYEDEPALGLFRNRWQRLRDRIDVRRKAHTLAASYDAVHGHFSATRYLPLAKRAVLCAFFREPVGRLISHHGHRVRHHNPPYPTPVQFASKPRQQRLYDLYTGGLPMKKFAFVGITEEYQTSLDLFHAMFGISIGQHWLNVGGGSRAEIEDSGHEDRHEIAARQKANHRIYDAARRRFEFLCRRHLP